MKIVLGQNKLEQIVPCLTVIINNEKFRIFQHWETGELTIKKATPGTLSIVPRLSNSVSIK